MVTSLDTAPVEGQHVHPKVSNMNNESVGAFKTPQQEFENDMRRLTDKTPAMNDLMTAERATLDVRLNDLLKFLNAPGDWGYGTPMADLTLYLLNFREHLNRT